MKKDIEQKKANKLTKIQNQVQEILEREYPNQHPAQTVIVPALIDKLYMDYFISLVGKNEVKLENDIPSTRFYVTIRNTFRAELRKKISWKVQE